MHAEITPGDSIHAVKYKIDLQEIDMDAKTIMASTTITLVPLINDLNVIQLQLIELTVDSVFVDMVKISSFTHADEVLNIPLSSSISIGDTTDVMVYYQGEPFHESWGGFHYSGQYAFNLGVGISWIPHNLGKTWFPCIDDFTDRATYEVIATVPENMAAVGGGALMGITNNGNGTHTWHWILNNPIPTYLASIAIGEYSLVEDLYIGINGDVPITYYVRPSDTSKIAGSFARIHDIMAIYEDRFGAYSWDRVGYVGTAIGAMEHATNIAYPNFCISGNDAYEDLYAHELSHMWFGDKVTCDKAEEMWINEGWATFCANYYVEVLDGYDIFKEQMRDMHANNLGSLHNTEGGYIPLNNIPQEYTYGTNAYDKGATVVQALRAYLGDDVFFAACKAFLEDLAFTSVSSYDMEANFTANTGVDMSGFFNNYVYHGGAPNYSIDSFNVMPQNGTSEVTVYLKQKRHGPEYTGNHHIVEVSFMDADWNVYTDTIHFSGSAGYSTKIVPFYPEAVFLDLEEKYMDATIDNYAVFTEPGEHIFTDTQFRLELLEITDSAFIQVTNNFAHADSISIPPQVMRVSDFHYWTISGIIPETFNATGRFNYSKGYLDKTLILSESDSVVILYRTNSGMPWELVDFTVVGLWNIGYIYVENLQMGEYTLGVIDISVGMEDDKLGDVGKENMLHVYPNPGSGTFHFSLDHAEAGRLQIFSPDAKLIHQINIQPEATDLSWDPGDLPAGTYVAVLIGDKEQLLTSRKMIYKK
jgi:aminopeptidase N